MMLLLLSTLLFTHGAKAFPRPACNTGSGFYVSEGKLYDANEVEFRIRGVNKNHYDLSSPGVAKSHANAERWVIYDWDADNVALLMAANVEQKIVPIPGLWDATCKHDAQSLSAIVDKWVDKAEEWLRLDSYMLLNIANEWGPANDTVWRDAYVEAVGRLRGAGYKCPLLIDAGGCGQDNEGLVSFAKDVFASDPQQNIIFSQHIYGNWAADGSGAAWQTDLDQGLTNLQQLSAFGACAIVGEFGPGRNLGPSPCDISPKRILQGVEARQLGWMAWAWDDNAAAGDDWFALSLTGDYNSTADLTTFGKTVVEDPLLGLLKLAQPATIFPTP